MALLPFHQTIYQNFKPWNKKSYIHIDTNDAQEGKRDIYTLKARAGWAKQSEAERRAMTLAAAIGFPRLDNGDPCL